MSTEQSTIETVQYREIPGTDGGYRAGNDGSIWCCLIRGYSGKRGVWRRLSPNTPDPKGYLNVRLKINGRFRHRPVHALILEAFVGLRPEGMECRHLNGNPGDNRLVNLQWGTYQENREDMKLHGRTCRHKTLLNKGATLNTETVILLRERARAGETMMDISRDLSLNYRTVMRAVNGSCWSWIPGALPKTPGQEKRVRAILEETQ